MKSSTEHLPIAKWLACAVVAMILAGCGADTPPKSASSSADQEHAHDDHDHHHDHGIPDHKPATFAEAVRQLPRRQKLVVSEFKVGHLDHALEAVGRFQDLIRWLPELAADTDLVESDWNAVQAIAQRMEAIVRPWPGYQSKPAAQEIESLTELTGELRPLADKTLPAQISQSE
jgi:hypothetical protein